MKIKVAFSVVLLQCLLCNAASFAEDTEFIQQLANLDIQDLMKQEITSVLRKEQPLSNAAAAVYVITKEEIRRAGLQGIPELLRSVPGLTVVRTGAGQWMVTARGFDVNGSSKLLVLIDGRSVYSPVFSGVFWDVQDVIPEDVERIEVIRGPGAVSWGENAVNGVINIITKHSIETKGLRVSTSASTRSAVAGSFTYGDQAGPDTTYRLFGKSFSRRKYTVEDDAEDRNWELSHGGFRLDSALTRRDELTLQGDIYQGDTKEPLNLFDSFAEPFTTRINNRTNLTGGNVLFRWGREVSSDSTYTVQGYFDRTNRHSQQFGEGRSTYDLDLQHHLRLSSTHDFVYGTDFRATSDDFDESLAIALNPKHRTDTFANAFVQDEITLLPERLAVIPGLKFGYNDYSQLDFQPALKTTLKVTPKSTLWASVSRAVRSPSRIDEDIVAHFPPNTVDGQVVVPTLIGDKGFDAERLYAYEVGYRGEISNEVSFDVATFYQRYTNLLSASAGTPFFENTPGQPHIISPFMIENGAWGTAYGAETVLQWKPSKVFDLSGAYSVISLDFNDNHEALKSVQDTIEKETPKHQANIKAHWQLNSKLEVNGVGYFVDAIEAFDVPSYIRADLQLGYKVSDDFRIDLVGSNLTDKSHREWDTPLRSDRAYLARITYEFNK